MLRYISLLALGLGLTATHAQANPHVVRGPVQGGHHYGQFHNYHVNYGRSFNYGYYYPGSVHRHWSYCYWDVRYRTYLYFDPCVRTYYYFCPRDTCYYPVSYCPHRTYSWGCTPAAGPIDPAVRVVTAPQVQRGFALNQGPAVQGPGPQQRSLTPQGPQSPGFKGPQVPAAPKAPQTPQNKQQQPGDMFVDQNPGTTTPKIGPAPPPVAFAQGTTTKATQPSAPGVGPNLELPLGPIPGAANPKVVNPATIAATPIEPVNPEIAMPRVPNGLNLNPINE